MAKEIVVIGGGAAGLMAAITAARQGAAVTVSYTHLTLPTNSRV